MTGQYSLHSKIVLGQVCMRLPLLWLLFAGLIFSPKT